jgi:hypothetical protein
MAGDTRYKVGGAGNLRTVPVAKRSSGRELGAVLIAAVGIAVAVVLGFAMLRLARSGEVEIRLGDDRFQAGRTDRLSAEIDERGPFLVSDLAGGTRDLWINHLGDDPDSGWVAFAARPAGAPRNCTVNWNAAQEQFVDSCDGTAYPPDGTGLERYPVIVENGQVIVDVNRTGEREPDVTLDTFVESGTG